MTANFQAIAPIATAQFTIAQTGVTLNRVTGRYRQTVTLTNNGGALASAAYVTDGLPSGVAMYQPSGATSAAAPAGSPYKELGATGAGATTTLVLEFTRTGTPPIAYTPRVLAAGVR